MPNPGEAARHRYEAALDECAAAESGLEEQHLRPGVVHPSPDEEQPTLDPEHEAAADRLDAAEGELRDSYVHRNDPDADGDAAAELLVLEKEIDALSAERDELAEMLDQVAAKRDAGALERDLLAAGRDRKAEQSAEFDAGLINRFESAVDRDMAAGDRAASGLDRRYAAEHRDHAAAARLRAAGRRGAAAEAENLSEHRIDELHHSIELSNTVGEAVGMIRQRHHLDSVEAVELLLEMCRSEGLDLTVVANRISAVRWLP